MMKPILRLSDIDKRSESLVGGKAVALAKMAAGNLRVPRSLCLTTDLFDRFLDMTGLRDNIFMEYYRKRFEDMRWEEIWDLSLRIKNMFLHTPLPSELSDPLHLFIDRSFRDRAVVVRSSAIGEDSAQFSFAGIHESYVNVRGTDAILKHVKLVWASLFSDAAILYRNETGLDINASKMAVIVQEFINGQKSGVAFSKSPTSDMHMMIEAVHGLNQGLVDGIIEPDRWLIGREDGRIWSYTPPVTRQSIQAGSEGIAPSELSPALADRAPLTDREMQGIYRLSRSVEGLFGSPQDTEWTYAKRTLYCLQSRPITTAVDDEDSQRQWYLSLKRSMENLTDLRDEIEGHLIPEMQDMAREMEALDLSRLTDAELADELARRQATFDRWRDIYWEKFIPFAHGVRLFGEIYNRQVMPDDPYEFTQLLVATDMQSLERNRMLAGLATFYTTRVMTAAKGSAGEAEANAEFDRMLDDFLETFRNPLWGLDSGPEHRESIIALLKQMGDRRHKKPTIATRTRTKLERRFIASFPEAEQTYARELLDLARVSYKLRDDDNIYLGKIEGQLTASLDESKGRLGQRLTVAPQSLNAEEAILLLKNPRLKPSGKETGQFSRKNVTVTPRQLLGQPAGRGLASGPARIIETPQDIFAFTAGEIIVCDAIDPNMTFIIPIAAAVVERRGGMLIHGAIIAREYGLPCVTGVPDAVDLIRNGQHIVVDGYLGIVTVSRDESEDATAPVKTV